MRAGRSRARQIAPLSWSRTMARASPPTTPSSTSNPMARARASWALSLRPARAWRPSPWARRSHRSRCKLPSRVPRPAPRRNRAGIRTQERPPGECHDGRLSWDERTGSLLGPVPPAHHHVERPGLGQVPDSGVEGGAAAELRAGDVARAYGGIEDPRTRVSQRRRPPCAELAPMRRGVSAVSAAGAAG